LIQEFVKNNGEVVVKEFVKASHHIQKYLKRLQELNKIPRVGGRKMGEWRIIDDEYEGFFDRI